MRPRVVLAYSGGLDTSVAVAWLQERGYDVVAATIDVGQPGDLARTRDRAGRLGAVESHLVDAKEDFVSDFVFPALAMNALYQGRYPLASALSRPLIARVLAKIAAETGAAAVAHGCTGKGNDQVRFEVSLSTLAPDREVLAPVREWGMTRSEAVAYAQRRGLPIETMRSSPYSIDENLWGRSIECGVLEDPWSPAPPEVFELTVDPADAAGSARDVVVAFEGGAPTALDGEALAPVDLIDALAKIAGSFGCGRVDMVEDRLVGIKSREVYEAPAALPLICAHRDLEALVLERTLAREKRRLEEVWTNLVYEGLWFSPLREAIDAFADVTQPVVTGEVRLRFEPGGCRVVGRRSPAALYDPALATYESGDSFDHADAAGFVHLWGLSTKQWARVREGQRRG